MALPEPDMTDCCLKKKCCVGVNMGKVYSTCSPCGNEDEPGYQGHWSEEICDCIPPWGVYLMKIETKARERDEPQVAWAYEIPEPYFTSDGDYIERVVTQWIIPEKQSDPNNSVFKIMEPEAGGDETQWCAEDACQYHKRIVPRKLEFNEWVCPNNPFYNQASTVSGSVSLRYLKNHRDLLIDPFSFATYLTVTCREGEPGDERKGQSASQKFEIEYIGPGMISDWYSEDAFVGGGGSGLYERWQVAKMVWPGIPDLDGPGTITPGGGGESL